MTSSAVPFGMLPVQQLSAGYNTQGFETLPIADGYATAIYNGDVVKPATTGYVQKDTGTSTLTPIGVFVGCSYVDPNIKYWLNSNYWIAATTSGITTGPEQPLAKVVTDPNAVFAIQADGSIPLTALFANAAIIQTAGSAAGGGRSKNALDSASINTTSTLPLRIVGLAPLPDNDWADTYTVVLVKFNNHQLTTLTGI